VELAERKERICLIEQGVRKKLTQAVLSAEGRGVTPLSRDPNSDESEKMSPVQKGKEGTNTRVMP